MAKAKFTERLKAWAIFIAAATLFLVVIGAAIAFEIGKIIAVWKYITS